MPNSTVYLKNYQPPSFTIETVDLNFDLYDDHALVSSTLKLIRQHPGVLHLYGNDLELISLHMNGQKLESGEYMIQEGDLIVEKCPDEMTLTIVTRIQPQKNTQ